MCTIGQISEPEQVESTAKTNRQKTQHKEIDLFSQTQISMRHQATPHQGFVFQSFHLIPSLTALENVMLPLELAGRENAEGEALSVLTKVGLLQRKGHYPRQLSGGEKQRVAIARAFVTRPAVLFADEPTGNLDSKTGGLIIDLLFDLNKESGTTLVLVTHDISMAERCDRTIHIESGRILDPAAA